MTFAKSSFYVLHSTIKTLSTYNDTFDSISNQMGFPYPTVDAVGPYMMKRHISLLSFGHKDLITCGLQTYIFFRDNSLQMRLNPKSTTSITLFFYHSVSTACFAVSVLFVLNSQFLALTQTAYKMETVHYIWTENGRGRLK